MDLRNSNFVKQKGRSNILLRFSNSNTTFKSRASLETWTYFFYKPCRALSLRIECCIVRHIFYYCILNKFNLRSFLRSGSAKNVILDFVHFFSFHFYSNILQRFFPRFSYFSKWETSLN